MSKPTIFKLNLLARTTEWKASFERRSCPSPEQGISYHLDYIKTGMSVRNDLACNIANCPDVVFDESRKADI